MTNGTGSPSADRTWRAAAGRGAKAGVPRRSGQDHVPSGVRLGRDASAKTRRPASAVPATMVSPPPTYAIATPPVASPNRMGRSAGIASITRPPAATAAPTTRANRESRSTYMERDVTVAGALARAGSAWGEKSLHGRDPQGRMPLPRPLEKYVRGLSAQNLKVKLRPRRRQSSIGYSDARGASQERPGCYGSPILALCPVDHERTSFGACWCKPVLIQKRKQFCRAVLGVWVRSPEKRPDDGPHAESEGSPAVESRCRRRRRARVLLLRCVRHACRRPVLPVSACVRRPVDGRRRRTPTGSPQRSVQCESPDHDHCCRLSS